jgi:hypothetical protein
MNIPSYDYNPRFVQADLSEKHAAAARERLARQARRTAHARASARETVRRRLGLQLIALGTALRGPLPEVW